jgi:hypothetical protein
VYNMSISNLPHAADRAVPECVENDDRLA